MKEITFFIDRFSHRMIKVMSNDVDKFIVFDSNDKDEELMLHGHKCKNLGEARTLFYKLIKEI